MNTRYNYRIEWNYSNAKREVVGDYASIYGLVHIISQHPHIDRYRITTDKYALGADVKGPSGHWEPVTTQQFGFTTQKGHYNESEIQDQNG